MAVEFGLWDTFRPSDDRSTADLYDAHFVRVELAERLGFDYYFVIEHQSTFCGHLTAPSVLLAALSQRTSSIRLGAMIWQLPFHNPVRLAQDVATLDQLSRGRVEFGTGLGVHEHEYLRWNLNFGARREIAEEVLEVVKLAWTQDSVTYKGGHWSFDEAFTQPKPYQQPHPPIWVAVHSPTAIDFAARGGYDIAQNIDTDDVLARKFRLFDRLMTEYHPGGRRADGTRPRKMTVRAVIVADTDEQADAIARRVVPTMYSYGMDQLRTTRIGSGTSRFLTGPDDTEANAHRREVFRNVARDHRYAFANGLAVVGSPSTVAARIDQQVQAMGLDVYLCEMAIPGMSAAEVEQSLRLFGEGVVGARAV